MISLELRISYPDVRTAESVMCALDPDNKGYVRSEIQGSQIIFRMEAKSAGTMRNTADDLMACIKVAEESVRLTADSKGDVCGDRL